MPFEVSIIVEDEDDVDFLRMGLKDWMKDDADYVKIIDYNVYKVKD